MTPADLYYFIGKCLAMDNNPDALRKVEEELSAGHVPWEDFVWMGSSHFVLPALYTAFKRNGFIRLLPADLVEHLSTIYNINLTRNKQIIEQSKELIRVLNSKGIEPVFLKGAGHLLQELYYDPGDRIMSDIDILVPQAEVQTAAKLLYANEYVHPEEFDDDDFEKHHHLPGFIHTRYAAMVELHHTIFPGKYQELLSASEIDPGKKKIEGFNAWVLSAGHQMALTFIHEQLVDDGSKYKSMLIKSEYDFYLLAKLLPAQEAIPMDKKHERRFNAWSALASATFNNDKEIRFKKNRSAKRFRRQFEYLLNHPEIFAVYQFLVLYRIRTGIILGSLLAAPFSKQSRRYIKKKAGSVPALKKYLKGLRKEL